MGLLCEPQTFQTFLQLRTLHNRDRLWTGYEQVIVVNNDLQSAHCTTGTGYGQVMNKLSYLIMSLIYGSK